MERIEIQASASAHIHPPETPIEDLRELARLKAMDRRRRPKDEVPGTVNAFAASLLLGSDVDAESIEASFVAEGLEQKKAEQLVDSQIDKPLNLHGITSKICAELGVPLGVRSDPQQAWDAAMAHCEKQSVWLAASAQVVTLKSILINAINRILLLPADADEPAAFRACKSVSVSDFRDNQLFRPLPIDGLDETGPAGEVKNEAPPMQAVEFGDAFRLKTWQRGITISRQTIINSEFDLLAVQIESMRRAAFSTLDREFAISLNSLPVGLGPTNSFFITSDNADEHRVSNSLASTALDTAAFNAMVAQLRKQIIPTLEGAPAGHRPKMLLVPPELEVAAREIQRDLYSGRPDDLFETVVCPWLSNAATGTPADTAKNAYLLDPQAGAFILAQLEGQTGPQLSLHDLNFKRFGMSARCIYDFAFANGGDPTAVIRNVAG